MKRVVRLKNIIKKLHLFSVANFTNCLFENIIIFLNLADKDYKEDCLQI